jgi:hypothetical protein
MVVVSPAQMNGTGKSKNDGELFAMAVGGMYP